MSRILDYLLAGLKGVLRHKLRSFLAVMGIVLAISALLSMLAVADGARQQILNDMERMGLRNVIVSSRRPATKVTEKEAKQEQEILSFGVKDVDWARCKETLPGLMCSAAVHEIGWPVVILGRKVNARVLGISADYFRIYNARLNSGRMLVPLDGATVSQVCLLATPVPPEVLGWHEPLGLDLTVRDQLFRIVGTITPLSQVEDSGKHSQTGATSASGSNLVTIYIPIETALGRFGKITAKSDQGTWQSYRMELDQIILQCDDPIGSLPPLRAIMNKGHKEIDYEISVPLEVLYQRQRTQEIFNLVLLMISGLTLLVGGVGIVNIMLVSVTERTKEIGIRRALGARQRDILIQFLIETLALTMTGGALGVLAGLGGVYAVERYTGWPVALTVETVVASFLVSVIAGVLFGLYPAFKAATVMPMVALRYE